MCPHGRGLVREQKWMNKRVTKEDPEKKNGGTQTFANEGGEHLSAGKAEPGSAEKKRTDGGFIHSRNEEKSERKRNHLRIYCHCRGRE